MRQNSKPQCTTHEQQGEHRDLPPRISEVIPKEEARGSKGMTKVTPKGMIEVTPKVRITRARNKFKLNSKALLKPSLKSTTPIDVDSDTPAKPASKKKVSFYMTPENPLFQLAQAAEVVEKIGAGLERGKKIKVTVKQGRDGRPKQSKKTSKRDDGKTRRGNKRRA